MLGEIRQERYTAQYGIIENLSSLCCGVKAVLSRSVSSILTCQKLRFRSTVENISASFNDSMDSSILGMATESSTLTTCNFL